MPPGRPTDFKCASSLSRRKSSHILGATEIQLADFFDVNESTIWRWKQTYPDFCNAIKVGKEIADQNVERSLYRKAMGYEFESEKIFCQDGAIVRASTREFVPPSDTAMIFWLKNRKPNELAAIRQMLISPANSN